MIVLKQSTEGIRIRRYVSAIVCVMCTIALMAGCARDTADSLRVVATTSHMEAALKEIGGEGMDVRVLISPGGCPGHYDVRPDDIQALAQSTALFTHGYELFVPQFLSTVGAPGPRVCRVNVDGNWLVPEIYDEAISKVARLLSDIDEDNAQEYEQSRKQVSARLAEVSEELRQELADVDSSQLTVICSEQQAPVLSWMGFDVVATYGRPEDFTPGIVHTLMRTGTTRKVRLVADNLQSGPNAGKQLADDLRAAHVTLSNFPGGYPDTETWEECLRDNVRRVLEALEEN